MVSEKDLIAYKKGKKKGFDKIYEAYSSGMYAICLRYVVHPEDAQDILQDVFVKVYESRSSYNIEKPFGAWIKTITIRTALNFLKKNNRTVLNSNLEDLPIKHSVEEVSNTLLKNKLEFALNQLPEGYRTVFSLYAIDNLTHKEIAEYLEIAEGTSKSQYSKAKKMLQQLIEKKPVLV